jgi:hypothetical protein
VHVVDAEYANLVPAEVLGGLSVLVAWGRLAKVVIPSRS